MEHDPALNVRRACQWNLLGKVNGPSSGDRSVSLDNQPRCPSNTYPKKTVKNGTEIAGNSEISCRPTELANVHTDSPCTFGLIATPAFPTGQTRWAQSHFGSVTRQCERFCRQNGIQARREPSCLVARDRTHRKEATNSTRRELPEIGVTRRNAHTEADPNETPTSQLAGGDAKGTPGRLIIYCGFSVLPVSA